MGKIKIVTDSSAEIPRSLAKELGITVIPLNVHIGGETFRDGVDITSAQVFQRMAKTPMLPTTSPPSVSTFRSVYERLTKTADEIISIHISAKLSDTIRHALQASEYFLGYSRIAVIDSRLASWGLGLLVVEAAKAAAAGASQEEIVRQVRGMIPKIYVVFFLDTLEYLQRSGRIGKAAALVGGMLNIKPLLILEDGEIMPLEKVRTREKAIERLYEFVIEFPHLEHISIIYGQLSNEAHELLKRLKSVFPKRQIELKMYSAALGVHVGPNCMGIVVYEGL